MAGAVLDDNAGPRAHGSRRRHRGGDGAAPAGVVARARLGEDRVVPQFAHQREHALVVLADQPEGLR